MKKFILPLILLITQMAFAEDLKFYCQSDDFNPTQTIGQALDLTFNEAGVLIEAAKVKGSWFCDDMTAKNPSIREQTPQTTVYAIEFHCGEDFGSLTVPSVGVSSMQEALYEFSFDEDDYFRTSTSKMSCVKK